MDEITIDANVLVGLLDQHDSLHQHAESLVRRFAAEGRRAILLDVCVSEAISVLCRRATQRRSNPPDLERVFATVHTWYDARQIAFVLQEVERHFVAILEVVQTSDGALNFNDAFLAVMQREGQIGDVASFDRNLDAIEDFRRIE